MSLREDIVALVPRHGIPIARVYHACREHDRGSIDAALLGLCAEHRLVRVGGCLHRPAHRLVLRCPRCHESRHMDEMLERGVCIRCASDESARRTATITHRTCPMCEREMTVEQYGHGSYCKPCTAIKQREYREAHNQRKTAEYAARAERYRAEGKTTRGGVRWTTMMENLKSASSPRRSSRPRSTSSSS